MRVGHRWKSMDKPPIPYVANAWGHSRCVKCQAQRFFHESGPRGGLYVTYTWPRGHRPTDSGVPKAYITAVPWQRVPPCIHVVERPRAA